MDYTIEIKKNMAIINCHKDLTVFFNYKLSSELTGMMKKGITFFVFDLSHTDWIDSMGIGCVLLAGKISEKKGKKVVLVGGNDKIKFAINKLNLDKWLRHANTLDEAKVYLSG